MNLVLGSARAFLEASVLAVIFSVASFADDSESAHRLTLADLAAYRAALSGKAPGENAKTSDPPARVVFRDLWNQPDAFRGRRVTIQGRVERIFRQGPIGSFPALAEVWIVSRVGDPFCLVVPQEAGTSILPVNDSGPQDSHAPAAIPAPGQAVRFTGTFLKMVRYSGGDGERLAPLVVGDQPPVPAQENTRAQTVSGSVRSEGAPKPSAASPAGWLLGLTMTTLIAGVVALQYLRAQSRRASVGDSGRRTTAFLGAEPPLEFIEECDDR